MSAAAPIDLDGDGDREQQAYVDALLADNIDIARAPVASSSAASNGIKKSTAPYATSDEDESDGDEQDGGEEEDEQVVDATSKRRSRARTAKASARQRAPAAKRAKLAVAEDLIDDNESDDAEVAHKAARTVQVLAEHADNVAVSASRSAAAVDAKSGGRSVKMQDKFYGKPLSQMLAGGARHPGLRKRNVPTLHVNRDPNFKPAPPRKIVLDLKKMGVTEDNNDPRLQRREGESQQQYLLRLCDEEENGKGGDYVRAGEGAEANEEHERVDVEDSEKDADV